jgi:hypothetical protein
MLSKQYYREGQKGIAELKINLAQGDLNKVEALLKENPALVSNKDDKGATPLHYAASYDAAARGDEAVTAVKTSRGKMW